MPHLLRPFQRLLVVDATAEVPDHLQKYSREGRQHAITSACRMCILGCSHWRFGACLEAPHRGKRAPCGKHRLCPATSHRCHCRPPPCQPPRFAPPAGSWQLLAYMGILSRCGWRQLSKHNLQQQPCQNSSPAASRRQLLSSGSRSLIGGCPLGACCPVVPHPLDLFECQAMPSIGRQNTIFSIMLAGYDVQSRLRSACVSTIAGVARGHHCVELKIAVALAASRVV